MIVSETDFEGRIQKSWGLGDQDETFLLKTSQTLRGKVRGKKKSKGQRETTVDIIASVIYQFSFHL